AYFTALIYVYVFILICLFFFFVFFFSSRRRHTRSTRDWSSDVCSSDLTYVAAGGHVGPRRLRLDLRARELQIGNGDGVRAVEIERLVVLVRKVGPVERAGRLQRRGVAGQRPVERRGSAERLIDELPDGLEIRRDDVIFHV